MTNIGVSIRSFGTRNIPAVTSLQVAESFGKQHKHVMRDIRQTMANCLESFTETNFGLSEYVGLQVRFCRQLERQGFVFPGTQSRGSYDILCM